MASISTDKKTGRRRILFFDANNDRKQIRLGKVPMKQAEAVKVRRRGVSLGADQRRTTRRRHRPMAYRTRRHAAG